MLKAVTEKSLYLGSDIQAQRHFSYIGENFTPIEQQNPPDWL